VQTPHRSPPETKVRIGSCLICHRRRGVCEARDRHLRIRRCGMGCPAHHPKVTSHYSEGVETEEVEDRSDEKKKGLPGRRHFRLEGFAGIIRKEWSVPERDACRRHRRQRRFCRCCGDDPGPVLASASLETAATVWTGLIVKQPENTRDYWTR
jgi:hypothetical protein